jgi:glycosyltransferase involved in cell wall biosynthesis
MFGRVPALAVVIPTRDRADLLADCLRSLAAQGTSDLEVLVVDDGSDAPLAPVVRDVDARFRCHRQEPAGLNAARNAGARLTTAPVIAYLDDDTLLRPGWAAAVAAAFAQTGCSGLGGRVELALPAPAPPWLTHKRRRYLAELELGGERQWLDGIPLPVGANCAVRRDELERVGPFREGLDRVGPSLISSGETEFFLRLRRAGGRLLYDPGAAVVHRVPAERMTLEWFHRRAYAQGVSDELLTAPDTARPAAVRRAREVVRAGRSAPILAKALVQHRGTANARLWLSYCRGRLAAIGAPAAGGRAPAGRTGA